MTEWWAEDPGQRARADSLLAEIEGAVGGDPARMEALRAEAEAADLHEDDRRELVGRCFQYLADMDRATGQGP